MKGRNRDEKKTEREVGISDGRYEEKSEGIKNLKSEWNLEEFQKINIEGI